jgi:hypothetical protein
LYFLQRTRNIGHCFCWVAGVEGADVYPVEELGIRRAQRVDHEEGVPAVAVGSVGAEDGEEKK